MRKGTVLITVMALLMALPVIVLAIDLPETGQTTCYDAGGSVIACPGTGQDGDIKAGVAWPSPRFTITYCDATGPCTDQSSDCDGNASTDVVTDNLTGLVWPRDGNLGGGTMNWSNALTYANGLSLCGYTDWRLPNVNELESLINAEEAIPATWLNGQGFSNVQSYGYWSSTTFADATFFAWLVDMDGGDVFAFDKTYNFYVWPVRGTTTTPAEVWKTGQTPTSPINPAPTGSDGDIQAGVDWSPSTRFTDNGDGTVMDNLTGLMWLTDANCINTHYPGFDADGTAGDGAVTWQHALDFVAGINSGTYSNCGAGYADWRLPNRKELRSLIDYSRSNPALPSGHPFSNVQSDYYWSSTTYADGTDHAWFVGMDDGGVDAYNKTYDYYVWPVRNGALSLSEGQDVVNYPPVETPVKNSDPALCKPFGVGDVTGGTLSLRVGLPYFSANVDIYLALYVPVIDPDNVYLITPSDIQPVSAGLTPWKADTGGDIDESLFGDIPITGLPSGTYYLGVFVTPHGSLDTYYLWVTYFIVP